MADIAPRDQNRNVTLQATSEADGTSPVNVWADPVTHSILVEATLTPVSLQDVNLTKVGGTAIALGNTTMSASLPVTIASNQTAFPVTLTSTTITGTVAVTQSTSPWIVAGGGTAGSAATGVVTVQGIASMTPVQVSQATGTNLHAVIDSGTITTVSTVTSISQWAGTAIAVSNGGVTNGTLRVTMANDSTGILASIGSITSSITPGTAAGNLGKAEDAQHASGDTGVFTLAVRNDTLADVSGSNGDYIQSSTDLKGRVMVGSAPRTLKANQITTITTSAAETTIVTAVASTFLDLYGIIVTNTSATAVTVAIKDATAGTTRLNIAVPAGDTRGFMLPIDAAIKQTSSNNNWTATTQSVTSVIITALTVANL